MDAEKKPEQQSGLAWAKELDIKVLVWTGELSSSAAAVDFLIDFFEHFGDIDFLRASFQAFSACDASGGA